MKKLNKFLTALIALMILLVPFSAFAEQAAPAEPLFYELSAEDTVLTVRLPGAEGAFGWEFEISNPASFELLTMETAEDGAMTASFRAIAEAETTVSLILRGLFEGEDAAEFTKVLEINIAADGKLAIAAVLERDPFAEWLEYGDEGCVLTVRLPGGEHSFELVDPDMIELITMETTEDGLFAASFMATMEKAGLTEIVFASEDGLTYNTVDLFINESGILMVQWADTFEILIPAAE